MTSYCTHCLGELLEIDRGGQFSSERASPAELTFCYWFSVDAILSIPYLFLWKRYGVRFFFFSLKLNVGSK